MSRRKREEEKEGLLLEDIGADAGSGSSNATPKSRRSGEESRRSFDRGSITSVSTTSLVLENINANATAESYTKKPKPREPAAYRDDDSDPELPRYSGEPGDGYTIQHGGARMSRHLQRIIWIVSLVAALGWGFALILFVFQGRWRAGTRGYYDYDHESPMKGTGKKVTLDQIQSGQWIPRTASVSWIAGANGEDGLLLEQNARDGFLVVEDVRARNNDAQALAAKVLMKNGRIRWHDEEMLTEGYWVSPDMTKVLILTKRERVFRHSFTGLYWILDVASQEIQPLDPQHADGRVQLAQWSPQSDAIAFTRDNNLFLRMVGSDAVRQVTDDGGSEYFYGIPDWVYEEEVFGNDKATWWSNDGAYVAFLRTNETMVQEYPVQFFIKRPSGDEPEPGLENYPEVKQIKYPKAGSPNPVSDMLFYDVSRNEMFPVDVEGGYKDDDRLIINVLWADNGKVLVQEANRESDHTRYVLVDMDSRTGKTVRSSDLTVDGGWVEPGLKVIYVPADAANGRPSDGYIEVTVADDNDHLGYYTPIDNPKPIMLTRGNWEVDGGPLAVDLKRNLVYFTSTYNGPTQRLVMSAALDGSRAEPIVPVDKAYWDASFSSLAGYVSLTNFGPGIPYQKIVATPAMKSKLELDLEDNKSLAEMARKHELPHNVYTTINIDGVDLQVLERRPPHFDPKKKYPVLFYLYGGPGSQQVSRRFHVDFQSAVASSLNYVVVTVDNRGTGFIGRKARNIIRGQFGKVEAHDQIEAAKAWAKKPYVDDERMAIWGWSYGGFMTLKVLEADAGETFKYGVAVAPVTDWRYYDSIYTERYMRTPQNNPSGYADSAISNVTALGQNVRFMIMHGVADDNVHMQNTLTLLDKLDLAGVDNYDVHFFPDSDHSIYFHNANYMVYERLEKWLINAMNGVWYETGDPRPEK
jgi:dipeptidyl aminopeptidase B